MDSLWLSYNERMGMSINKKGLPKWEAFWLAKRTEKRHIIIASIVPAATAVPMTPATFGPMACIRR